MFSWGFGGLTRAKEPLLQHLPSKAGSSALKPKTQDQIGAQHLWGVEALGFKQRYGPVVQQQEFSLPQA